MNLPYKNENDGIGRAIEFQNNNNNEISKLFNRFGLKPEDCSNNMTSESEPDPDPTYKNSSEYCIILPSYSMTDYSQRYFPPAVSQSTILSLNRLKKC